MNNGSVVMKRKTPPVRANCNVVSFKHSKGKTASILFMKMFDSSVRVNVSEI